LGVGGASLTLILGVVPEAFYSSSFFIFFCRLLKNEFYLAPPDGVVGAFKEIFDPLGVTLALG